MDTAGCLPASFAGSEGRDARGEVASASHPFATLNALVMTSAVISARFSTGSGQVAQLAEHAAENRGVGSSNLPLATSVEAQFRLSCARSSAERTSTDWYRSAERGNSLSESARRASWMSRAL